MWKEKVDEMGEAEKSKNAGTNYNGWMKWYVPLRHDFGSDDNSKNGKLPLTWCSHYIQSRIFIQTSVGLC